MVQMKKLDFSSQVYTSITFEYKITLKLFPIQVSKWWLFSEQKWESGRPWIDPFVLKWSLYEIDQKFHFSAKT